MNHLRMIQGRLLKNPPIKEQKQWYGTCAYISPQRKKRSKHASVKTTSSSRGYRNLQIPSFEYLNESQKKN